MTRAFLPLILTIICFFSTQAEQRLDFAWGHQTTRCTYLSPITYTGPGYSISYEWRHGAWQQGMVGMQATGEIDYGYLLSRAKNSRMYTLALDLAWGVERLWNIGNGFHIAAGGTTGVNGGVLYLPRNGNNPAQALFWAGVSATLRMDYDHLRLLHMPIKIRARVDVPTAGAFFCPQYGETYYEIYVGNHSGLAHFGWWGNRPHVKTQIMADWKLGRNALTLGFEYRYQGLECNDISTRIARCSGIIGISF